MRARIINRRQRLGSPIVIQSWTAAALALLLTAGTAIATTPAAPTTAKQLVDESREAAIAGDNARQFALLRQAVRIDPNDSAARWQLGQIQVDGEWMAIEEAQRRAVADPAQGQYRELRGQYGKSVEDQLILARWTRKNNLHDESRFHWANVLTVQPNNEEAQRALDMRWHNGQLASRDDVANSKERMRQWKRSARKWTSAATKWKRAVAGDDAATRDAALARVRSLREPEAFPALEGLTLAWDRGGKLSNVVRQIGLAFVEALAATPSPAATGSLVRQALFSPADEVRGAAVTALQTRPVHEYVPMLLSGLGMPLESTFQVMSGPDGSVHYRHSLYREGPEADVAIDVRQSALQHVFPGRRYLQRRGEILLDPNDTDHARARQIAVNAAVNEREFGATAAAMELQVLHANQAIEAQNYRIMPVLALTTGNDFDTPKEWWQWWTDSNEYYAEDHPVENYYYTDAKSYFHGRPYDTVVPVSSCFVAGTPVWTKTGQRPIESLQIGDLVLAQNVETGELAYKPVTGRTVRPPSPILKLSLDGEVLLTTRGHPFWVAGVGWRMAKELGDAAILHGVTGSARLAAVEPADEAEAYNLVVADFNTYFVGETGVLVHDNTPRRPTRAALPGLATK